MKSYMPRADAPHELQRSQNHEEKSGKDVDQGKSTMTREPGIQGGGGIAACSFRRSREQDNRPASGGGYPDERQENYQAP